MSGLFGIVQTRQAIDVHQYLMVVGQRLSHREWYTGETWIAPDLPLGIGRVGIGIFNREAQPAASANGECYAWLSGEFYQTGAMKHEMMPGKPTGEISDPELALYAYQEYGLEFARYLNGAYFIVIYDAVRRKLVFASDPFGLYPHYYHLAPGQLVFSPEVKGILCAPGIERKPNLTAAAEYFRFQQVLGEKTFHEGIYLFPYGSVAQYDLTTGAWFVQRYWDWDKIPYRPEITFEEAVEEAGYLLQKAVVDRVEGVRPGVFLSGGLDSRTILGLIPKNAKPASVTFGKHNTRDVVYANRIARAYGSDHHWFDLPDGKWVAENANLHLDLTEGFHSWVHMHGITMLDSLRGIMDCNLSGWDGGTVMGHSDHINPIYNYPVDEWTVMLQTYQQFSRSYTWPGLTDPEERLLYTAEFRKQAWGRAFESMMEEFSRFWNFRHEYAAEYFYVVNHCWRFTHHMITTMRASVESRFPFWDYDLIHFIYSLPPQIRGDQILYRTIITKKLPVLARIPYDKQDYLPSVNPFLHNLQMFGVRALKRLKIFPNRVRLYADYENYLRHELREWAENILFDPRTVERGIYNADFIRSLMNRHLAGKEDWILGKIAPLITYEMVLREYFD